MKKKILSLSALSLVAVFLSLPGFRSPVEAKAATYVSGSEVSFIVGGFTYTTPKDFGSNFYYKNDGTVGSAFDYNIRWDNANHELVLKNFIGANITCTSSSPLTIRVNNDAGKESKVLTMPAMADSGKNIFGIKTQGDVRIYSDTEQSLSLLTSSVEGGIYSASLYSRGAVMLGGKLNLSISLATVKTGASGIWAKKGIVISDDVALDVDIGVLTNTCGLKSDGGTIVIDSTKETKIYLERQGDNESAVGKGIYNEGGFINIIGSGHVLLETNALYNSTAIQVHSMSSGSVMLDGATGGVDIKGFHKGIDVDSSGGEDIQISDGAILNIKSDVGDADHPNIGIVSFSSDVEIDGGNYKYLGNGAPLQFTGSLDHQLRILNNSKVDWASDAEIDLSNALTSVSNLGSYCYFKVADSAGNKPNFGDKGIYLDASTVDYCHFVDDSWVESKRNGDNTGILYDTPYDIPYYLAGPTAGSSLVKVNNDVALDMLVSSYVNGGSTASLYEEGKTYNATYNMAFGTLTLSNYDGGTITFEGESDESLLKIVLVGENKIHGDRYGIRATKGSIVIYAGSENGNAGDNSLQIDVKKVGGDDFCGIQIDIGDLYLKGEAKVGIEVKNSSNYSTRGVALLSGDFYLGQKAELSVKTANDHSTSDRKEDAGVFVNGLFTLDTTSSLSLMIDNSATKSNSYALYATSANIYEFGMASFTWNGDNDKPYSPSDAFNDPSLEIIDSYEAPLGKRLVFKGETKTVTVKLGNADRSESKYMPGEKVGIEATYIPGVEFKKWVSEDSLAFDDQNASSTKFVMPSSDTTVQATYTLFSKDPVFDSHGASDSGYINFELVRPAEAVRLISDSSNTDSKVMTTDAFDSKKKIHSDFVAEGNYYIAAQLKDGNDNSVWLISEPIAIAYGKPALEYSVSLYDVQGDLGDSVTKKSGAMTLPEYTLGGLADNQKFVAWAEGSESGKQYKPGDEYEVFDDVSFYAVIAFKSEYTISYNANGGSGTVSSDQRYEGDKYPLPMNTFTAPEGKEFAGWKVNNEGELLQPEEEVAINGNIELFPQWKDKPAPAPISSSSASSSSSSQSSSSASSSSALPSSSVSSSSAVPSSSVASTSSASSASSSQAPISTSNVASSASSASSSEVAPTPSDNNPSNGGLPAGAIVGITLAAVFVVGIAGFSIVWFVIKKKTFADFIALFKKPSTPSSGSAPSNAAPAEEPSVPSADEAVNNSENVADDTLAEQVQQVPAEPQGEEIGESASEGDQAANNSENAADDTLAEQEEQVHAEPQGEEIDEPAPEDDQAASSQGDNQERDASEEASSDLGNPNDE